MVESSSKVSSLSKGKWHQFVDMDYIDKSHVDRKTYDKDMA